MAAAHQYRFRPKFENGIYGEKRFENMDGSHIQYNIDDIVVLYRKGAKQVKYKDVVERTKNGSYGSENAMKKECQDS